jgi:hypothetical protein
MNYSRESSFYKQVSSVKGLISGKNKFWYVLGENATASRSN